MGSGELIIILLRLSPGLPLLPGLRLHQDEGTNGGAAQG